MNWYQNVRINSLIKVSSPKFFAEKLERFYELEYKYAMIRLRNFNGVDRRRENIIKRFAYELSNMIPQIVQPILGTFQEWLSKHALLNPRDWARARARARARASDGTDEGYEEPLSEHSLGTVLGEATHYHVNVVQKLNQNPEKFPNTMAVIRQVMKEQVDMDIAEIEESYADELAELRPDQKEQFIQQKTKEYEERLEDEDIIEYALEITGDTTNNGLLGFLSGLDTDYLDVDPADVLVEIYMAVFDGWYAYWKPEGIDQTRKNVEVSTNRLMALSSDTDPSQAIMAVSLALQTAHQSGQMMEHLTEYIDQHGFMFDNEEQDYEYQDLQMTFDDLAEKNTDIWDEELREMGVEI